MAKILTIRKTRVFTLKCEHLVNSKKALYCTVTPKTHFNSTRNLKIVPIFSKVIGYLRNCKIKYSVNNSLKIHFNVSLKLCKLKYCLQNKL